MDALCEAENLEKISTAADAAALQESFPTNNTGKTDVASGSFAGTHL